MAMSIPRFVVILFNWAFGALVLLAVFQIIVDLGALVTMVVRQQVVLSEEMRQGDPTDAAADLPQE